MIVNLNAFDSGGKVAVYKLGSFARRTLLHIQVQGAVVIRIAGTQDELMNPPPGLAGMQGLQLQQAMPGGAQVISLWWKGELWAVANQNGAQADFQILPFD